MAKNRRTVGRFAGLAVAVFLIFVICTLGCWVVAFAGNETLCIVGPDRC
jgi:hypothetical protein